MAKKKTKPKAAPKPKPTAAQRFYRDLGGIGRPLSGQNMIDVARTLTAREYDPIFKDIDRSEREVVGRRGVQQDRAKSYYDDIAKVFGANLTGQQASNTRSVDASREAAAAQARAIDSAEAQARGREAADAAVRGAGLDGGSLDSLAEASAKAKMRAQAQGATQENAARNAGAVSEAFLRSVGAATAQRGGETQGAITASGDKALGDLAAQRTKLNDDRNGKMTDTLLKIRQGEVERLLTEKGVSSDLAQAQIDADLKREEIQSRDDLEREKMRFQARLEALGYDRKDAAAQADREFKAEQNQLDRDARANGDGPGGKWASTKDQGKASDAIGGAVSVAKTLKRSMSRSQAAQVLLNGQKGQPVYETVKTAGGGTKQVRKLDAYGQPVQGRSVDAVDQLWASVALDVAYDGHISAANIKKLHARGIKVNQLGYPIRAKKTKPARNSPSERAPGGT